LADQIDKWKKGMKGGHSDKVTQALNIVYQAINGTLNARNFPSGGLPQDHSQAVGNIFQARSSMDEISNRAMSNPSAYYQSHQYGLKMGERFGNNPNVNEMGNKQTKTNRNELEATIASLESKRARLESERKNTHNPNVKNYITASINKCDEEIARLRIELKR